MTISWKYGLLVQIHNLDLDRNPSDRDGRDHRFNPTTVQSSNDPKKEIHWHSKPLCPTVPV